MVIYGIPLDPDISSFLYRNSISSACLQHHTSQLALKWYIYCKGPPRFQFSNFPQENRCTVNKVLALLALCFSANLPEGMERKGTVGKLRLKAYILPVRSFLHTYVTHTNTQTYKYIHMNHFTNWYTLLTGNNKIKIKLYSSLSVSFLHKIIMFRTNTIT